MPATEPLSTPVAREAADAIIPGHLHPLSFIDRLAWRLENDPPKQKGQRTRERLKLACARILERRGFHDLKAGDVSSEAGLAEGSFYLYFTDKRDVTRTVLTEYQEMYFSLQTSGSAEPSSTAFEAIRFANRTWFGFARANAGLIRCLYQFADEDSEFGQVLHQANLRWHNRVMRAYLRTGPEPWLGERELLLLVYLLGGMMDDLMRRLIIYPDQALLGILKTLDAGDSTLADVTSLVWLRLLRPQEPPQVDLHPAVDALAAALFPAERS